MGVLKRRPDVTLMGPRVVPVGRPCRFRVRLTCPKPVTVDGATFEIVSEIVAAHAGSSQRRAFLTGGTVTRRVARLIDTRTELTEGTHDYEVSVTLPENAPGTYAGQILSIVWTVDIHIDVPWWPDRRASFAVFVAGRGATAAGAPRVYVSDMRGPQGRGPYSELSVASTAIEAGETLAGRIALANVASNRYRAVRLALVAHERLGASTWDRQAVCWTIPLDNVKEEQPIPFRLTMPAELTPQFATARVSMKWFLQLEIDVAWSRNPIARMPIVVRTPEDGDDSPVEAIPLAVGSDRLQLVWRQAAEVSGFDYAHERLATLIGGNRLEIRREHRGRRGVALFAEAMLDEVDIGLRVDDGKLRCRDEAHAKCIAQAVDAHGKGLDLVEASDSSLTWVLEDGGTRAEPVAQFATRTRAFVRALVAARAELPAPAEVADLEPCFARVARNVGGRLRPAGMDVFGARDGVAYSLETRWDADDTLTATAVTVRPTIPVDARYHGTWNGDARPEQMPDGLAAILEDSVGLAIDAEKIEVYLAKGPRDANALTNRVEQLIGLGLALSMRGAGYR